VQFKLEIIAPPAELAGWINTFYVIETHEVQIAEVVPAYSAQMVAIVLGALDIEHAGVSERPGTLEINASQLRAALRSPRSGGRRSPICTPRCRSRRASSSGSRGAISGRPGAGAQARAGDPCGYAARQPGAIRYPARGQADRTGVTTLEVEMRAQRS
jgi:hypothetical protein